MGYSDKRNAGGAVPGGERGLKNEDCPFYDRGLCKLSIYRCQNSHQDYKVCKNYMIGFCPEGPNCLFYHPKGIIADTETTLALLANFPNEENWSDKTAMPNSGSMNMFSKSMTRVRCHNCGELGHKSTYCQEDPLTQEDKIKILAEDNQYNQQNMTVLCFKCKHYGHYANVCPMRGIP